MCHSEERSVSTAIRYKNCAQIFVSNVNKNTIRYATRDATNSYTVECEHGLKLFSQNKKQIDTLINIVGIFSKDIEMEFGMSKTHYEKSDISRNKSTLLPNDDAIKDLEDGEGYI